MKSTQLTVAADVLIAKLRRQIAAAETTALAIGEELGVDVGFFGEDGSLRLYDRQRDDTTDRQQRGAHWEDGGAVIALFAHTKKITWDGGGI